jgi:hypothetical protein
MLLLLLTILAARAALADVSYETMHLTDEGKSGLAEAHSRPHQRTTRALLVVGGRNDPEVLVPCHVRTQC